MRSARRLTPYDAAIAAQIQTGGGILYIDHGQPYLANGTSISRYRFCRLVTLGIIEPQDQPLITGLPAQSYIVNGQHAAP